MNEPDLSIKAVYQPAQEAGGDFYYLLDGQVVVLGDVPGKRAEGGDAGVAADRRAAEDDGAHACGCAGGAQAVRRRARWSTALSLAVARGSLPVES